MNSTKLGATHVASDDFTHLVAPSIVRTLKFMMAVTRGQQILSPAWVKESIKAKRLLPTENYLLVDRESEKRLDLDGTVSHEYDRRNEPCANKGTGQWLRKAVERGRLGRGMLRGATVFVTNKVAETVDLVVLEQLVAAAKGEAVLLSLDESVDSTAWQRLRNCCRRGDSADAWTLLVHRNDETLSLPWKHDLWMLPAEQFLQAFLHQSIRGPQN
eukprot:jgi/Hompol1/705/HPOL_000444-RA